MNRNAVAVVAVLVLVCSLVGVSSQTPLTGSAARGTDDGVDDAGVGDNVSAFMQRGVVAVNGSIDAGMWLAAFETADNLTRKQALVRQRAATLETRLDRLDARIHRFPPANTTSLELRARRVRLVAERDALRTAVSETKTTAAGEGVNATNLDELGRRVENLTVPPVEPNDSTADPTGTASTTASGAGTPSADRDDSPVVENRRSGATYSGP